MGSGGSFVLAGMDRVDTLMDDSISDCGLLDSRRVTTRASRDATHRRFASNSATQRASITSSRPTGPTPSPVLALRPIWCGLRSQDAGDAVADGVLVVGQLRPLGVDDAVEVHDAGSRPRPPCAAATASISAESRPRLAASVLGNSAADVGQGGGAQQGVGHGVQQHVGVAVADELPVVRHIDAAQPQRPARRRAMRVFANSNPQVARGAISAGRGQAGQSARIIPGWRKCDNASRGRAKPQALARIVSAGIEPRRRRIRS